MSEALQSKAVWAMKLAATRVQQMSDLIQEGSFSHLQSEGWLVAIIKLKEDFDEGLKTLNELQPPDEFDESMKAVAGFDRLYVQTQANIRLFIARDTPAVPVVPVLVPTPAVLPLPEMSIPKFDGSYDKWQSFRAEFEDLVTNNVQLNDIQRLRYLKTALSGTAAAVQASNDTYISLWAALRERFEKKRIIVSKYVEELLRLKPLPKENAAGLRVLVDSVVKNLRVLETYGLQRNEMVEMFLINIISGRLDEQTRKAYEIQLSLDDLPKFDDMLTFLKRRCHMLENIEFTKRRTTTAIVPTPPTPAAPRNQRSTSLFANQRVDSCSLCKQEHFIPHCSEFTKLTPAERFNTAKSLNLCINCLSETHAIKDCRSSGVCRHCRKKHHSMLHFGPPAEASPGVAPATTANATNTQAAVPASTLSHHSSLSLSSTALSADKQIILSTAIVKARDVNGEIIFGRLLLDNGSQPNFITRQMAQQLRLPKQRFHVDINGIRRQRSSASQSVIVHIESCTSDFSLKTECLILPYISVNIPEAPIDLTGWKVPTDIVLADPNFDKPQPIDFLLGSEFVLDALLSHQIKAEGNLPSLRDSVFGYVAHGSQMISRSSLQSMFCGLVSTPDSELVKQLKRFWELENVGSNSYTLEERKADQNFLDTHRRQADGRYVVELPTNEKIRRLGDSKQAALRRFYQLERRLSKNEELKKQYVDFINEYYDLGHMELASPEMIQQTPSYYLPHHAVLRPESSTTKLRVVFDASAESNTGISLNDGLLVGPTVQQPLLSILLRFRKHHVAFTADITKMYRQVLVQESQQPLQKILWRENENQPVREYVLKTVTYGTASAPYLATRVLNQLAEDEAEKFPAAAQILARDFYVDDVLSGAENLAEAQHLQQQLVELLNCGGFVLRKWCTNTPELFQQIPEDLRVENKTHIAESDSFKTLGMSWHPIADQLVININQNPSNPLITKRSILSDIARVYDPLGLAGPVIVTAKILLQRLWQQKFDWDDELDDAERENWKEFRRQLQEMKTLSVPRCVVTDDYKTIRLHGYSDSSTKAYGCCVYIQCVDESGKSTVRLLSAKSRVAPLKMVTIPRLELCGALLLAELIDAVKNAMQIPFDEVTLWTDSTVVLHWIYAQSSRFKTFVSHRISEIQQLTNPMEWRHVPTKDNPADIISRGVMPSELPDSSMWWSGPSFLDQPPESWPANLPMAENTDLPEMKKPRKTSLHVRHFENVIGKHSSLPKLTRIIAYVWRFINNCRRPKPERQTESLLGVKELIRSKLIIAKAVQLECFADEIDKLKRGKLIDKKSPLFRLDIMMDDFGILRVGGRLGNSLETFDTQHQIVLPKVHHFTSLIIRTTHQENGHAGQQALLALVRQTYWPIGAKVTIRQITKSCITCFKVKPRLTEQFMGQLPSARVTSAQPFINVGIDYAGPMRIKLTRRTTMKAYLAIFVCMATKAVHIEVVSDASSQAFIAALHRFTSRRGHCQKIFSDNGTNFVGARNELKQLYEFLADDKSKDAIISEAALKQIEFSFIPPRAPHFGGLWEAAVKSAKYHLKRIGNALLTFEELSTVTVKIEAILNSRPLVPASDDPNDLAALTPGHFLIGRPLVAIAEPKLTDIGDNRLRRWQLLQKLSQHFWQRWSHEYLTTLQQRAKTIKKIDFTPGALVILKEDNIPTTQWPLGRITAVYPGQDGLVRVVDVKTQSGKYRRSIDRICLLPTDAD